LAPLLGEDVAKHVQARAAIIMAELETTERKDAAAGVVWLKRAMAQSEAQAVAMKTPRNVGDLLALIS